MKSINLSINKRTLPTVILSISLLLSIFTYNTLKASSLSPTQVNAIITLLQSFGADQNTINKVRSTLTGQPYQSNTNYNQYGNSSNNSNSFCPNLYRNLYLGTKGQDVRELQIYLKNQGFYNYPEITGYYGPATMYAVQRFQAAKGIVSYGTPESTGYGVVGPKTRMAMGCGETVANYPSTIPTNITITSVDVSTEYRSYICPGCSYPEKEPVKILRVSLSNGQIVTALDKNQYWKFGKVIGISNNRRYVAFTVHPETGSADIFIYVFDARAKKSYKVTSGGSVIWFITEPTNQNIYWSGNLLHVNKDGKLYKSRSVEQPWKL